MLTLDEKKIRKGKPVGLPYQGSKKKISKKIVEIIKQNFGTDKPVYDIFGGGGAITAECLINGLEVHYNDLDRTITDMFQRVLSTDREFLKTLIVSREEFFRILDKENKTVDDNLKLLVNSFGNNRKDYLYSEEFSDLKHNLVTEIIKKHDVFDGYKKTETYKNAYRPFDAGKEKKNQVLQQLSRLQQLQGLQQLECVKVTNLDYTEFSGVENAILYLDPPYENTVLKGYSINYFDSQSFYDCAYEMSKKNIVLISSYEISDERFECVYEFKNARSTLSGGKRGKQTEKLFMVKRGRIMLELDEKKIRKGKPIGLPYQGSKKKISKKIVEIIKQNFGTEKPIYDVFGGGGAITAECLINGLEVHYNDLDETATSMFQKVVSEDRDYLKTLIVSRDEFLKIREKENKTVDDELKLLVNSFGNKRRTYLFSKEKSDIKYNLAIELIKNHDTFSGYKKTETYLKAINAFKERLQCSQQLERLQQLEQLQRLQQLEQLQQLQRVEATNLDYTEFSDIENSILYLDPPYENAVLEGYSIDSFDSKSFYDWAYEMSKNNIVLISSYEISDERFECVYEFKKARSTLQGGTNNDRTEKLFMVKKRG